MKTPPWWVILALLCIVVASGALLLYLPSLMLMQKQKVTLVCNEDKVREAWELCMMSVSNPDATLCLKVAKDIHCK